MTKKRPKNKPTKAAQSSAAAPEQSKIEDELDMLEDIKRDEDLYISESDVANISNFIRTTNKSFNSLGNIVVEKFNGRCSLAILHALIALFDTDSREREDVIRRLNIIYIVWRLPEMEAELRLKPQKNMTDIYSHPFSTFLFYAEQLEHVAESILARIIVTNNAGVIEKLTAPDFIQKAGKLDVYKVDRDAWEDFEIKNTAHWPEITEEMVSLAKAMRELGCFSERKDHEAGMAEAFYPLVHNPPTMLPPRMMPLGQEDPRMAAYRKIKDEDNPNLVADVLYSMTAGDDIQERIKEAFGDLEQIHEAQQIITYEDGKMLPSSDSEVYSESDSDSYDERAAEADFRALTAAAGASIELNDKVIAGCVDRILVGHALTTTKTEMMILFVKSCNLTHPQYDRLLSATRTDDSIILFIRTNVKFAGAFLVRNALSEQGGCELFKRYIRICERVNSLVHALEIVLKMSKEFMEKHKMTPEHRESVLNYVRSTVKSCEENTIASARSVRLVAMLVRKLLREHVISVEEIAADVKPFTLKFSENRECTALYKLIANMQNNSKMVGDKKNCEVDEDDEEDEEEETTTTTTTTSVATNATSTTTTTTVVKTCGPAVIKQTSRKVVLQASTLKALNTMRKSAQAMFGKSPEKAEEAEREKKGDE
uniref:CCR4-NOT transcription complex subunit 11 n=1 Tax=Caenorhabditis japonica TaxID=281687 RepID=A0A8R1HKQ5_CAEJA